MKTIILIFFSVAVIKALSKGAKEREAFTWLAGYNPSWKPRAWGLCKNLWAGTGAQSNGGIRLTSLPPMVYFAYFRTQCSSGSSTPIPVSHVLPYPVASQKTPQMMTPSLGDAQDCSHVIFKLHPPTHQKIDLWLFGLSFPSPVWELERWLENHPGAFYPLHLSFF